MIAYRVQKSLEKNIQSHRSCLCVLEGRILKHVPRSWDDSNSRLRFSAMFAELTDRIVPVAVNCRFGFFQRPLRSWNGLYLIFLFMNPTLEYEITFLNQLPLEATCSSGNSPYDVANHVQRILAETLGFEQCQL
ncbi:unnamed protein product [Brassica rapa subsp. trilocularis]